MSLTDKVIKNTYYYFLSQAFNFIFPIFLTPFIISKIGNTEFGIYALILGVTGVFGLFDLSVSSSFIKFISEHYNKKEFDKLNYDINTAIVFYFFFSAICFIAAFLLKDLFLNAVNIPPELQNKALFAYVISLTAFSAVNTLGVFNSVIASLQKTYLTSLYSVVLSVLNFICIIVLLYLGYGLYGIMSAYIFFIVCSLMISFFLSRKFLPSVRFGFSYFKLSTLKGMMNLGMQIQISKFASFAADKYDEFLLAYFSVIGNVTYYNLGNRIARVGRFIPIMLFQQVAPVAAELKARDEEQKLNELFADSSKYLLLISLPVFFLLILFSEVFITAWVGSGYETSAHLLRVLAIAGLINMIFSAPGNSITPNIGYPKFLMREGLILLGINLVLSYFLIKSYGIVGAAYGNSISVIISSVYVYFASSSFFKKTNAEMFKTIYMKPFLAAAIAGALSYCFYYIFRGVLNLSLRVDNIICLILCSMVMFLTFAFLLLVLRYLSKRDLTILTKLVLIAPPIRNYILRRSRSAYKSERTYENEFVSIFILTYNRLEFLKKCITALLPGIEKVNYELIIWDNNSDDGTREYLDGLNDKRIKIHHHDKNTGTNAKARAIDMCNGNYICGIDDDVLMFPDGWMQKMISAYKSIPRMGYLSADVIQDKNTMGAKPPSEKYFEIGYFGGNIILEVGPAGGWCFLISREVYNKVGKFIQDESNIFTGEDGNYVKRIIEKGYRAGILKDVKVYHATDKANNAAFSGLYEHKMAELVRSGSKKNRTGIFSHYRYYFYKFIEELEKEAILNENTNAETAK